MIARMLRGCLGLILLVAPLFAQDVGTPVNQTQSPPVVPYTNLYFYDGNGALQYKCIALQNQINNNVPGNAGYWSVAQGNLTNISVTGGTATINFTSTSFLWVGTQVVVAGSATTLLNGTYKILTVSGTTATFTTTAANGTYTDANVSTLQPQVNQPVWAIHVFINSGTTPFPVQSDYWAGAISQGRGIACSTRATF